MDKRIRDLVEQTPFVDTHEHLVEEETRLAGLPDPRRLPCNDWAYLFYNYLSRDLHSAGMPPADRDRFLSPDTPAERKYALVRAPWEQTRHTGYAQALRHTLRGLYGIEELDEKSAPCLAQRYRDLVRPGFYREILREKSNIETCQVNSTERIFMESAQPDLLKQDLSFAALSWASMDEVERDCGRRAQELDGWLEIIDWYFATYGPRAVAVKNQNAYNRRLDYEDVPKDRAAAVFRGHARGEKLEPAEEKALQDYLFRYCVGKATEYGLPVKLHTGYYAGNDYMPLARVKENAADLCPILERFGDTKFVLMHIGYPYQDEYIALAKHYRNVWADMCWAWIISPLASVRFLKELLVTAPHSKVLTFGGDYYSVETVYGHACVARQGIAQAVEELVAEGWVPGRDVPELVDRIMRGNAHDVFPRRG
jgi:hypothetical protein